MQLSAQKYTSWRSEKTFTQFGSWIQPQNLHCFDSFLNFISYFSILQVIKPQREFERQYQLHHQLKRREQGLPVEPEISTATYNLDIVSFTKENPTMETQPDASRPVSRNISRLPSPSESSDEMEIKQMSSQVKSVSDAFKLANTLQEMKIQQQREQERKEEEREKEEERQRAERGIFGSPNVSEGFLSTSKM